MTSTIAAVGALDGAGDRLGRRGAAGGGSQRRGGREQADEGHACDVRCGADGETATGTPEREAATRGSRSGVNVLNVSTPESRLECRTRGTPSA